MKHYRNSMKITECILQTVQDVGVDGAKISKLMQKSNLPHGRRSVFMEKLIGNGLINKIETEGKNTFIITQKGRICLEEYSKFSEIAENFGLEL